MIARTNCIFLLLPLLATASCSGVTVNYHDPVLTDWFAGTGLRDRRVLIVPHRVLEQTEDCFARADRQLYEAVKTSHPHCTVLDVETGRRHRAVLRTGERPPPSMPSSDRRSSDAALGTSWRHHALPQSAPADWLPVAQSLQCQYIAMVELPAVDLRRNKSESRSYEGSKCITTTTYWSSTQVGARLLVFRASDGALAYACAADGCESDTDSEDDEDGKFPFWLIKAIFFSADYPNYPDAVGVQRAVIRGLVSRVPVGAQQKKPTEQQGR